VVERKNRKCWYLDRPGVSQCIQYFFS